MEKFKDFLYDKSDIVIAIAILLIAALIIAWRLGAIVEYPKELIKESNTTQVQQDDDTSDENTDDEQDTTDDEQGTTDDEQDTTDDEQDATQDTSGNLWVDGILTKDVTVYWSGNSATAIIQCAVDAGLLESYSEYESICNNQGLSNPEQIPVGESTTFKAGSTKVDIVRKIKS